MTIAISFVPPQFEDEYDGHKMRVLVNELERLHAEMVRSLDDTDITDAEINDLTAAVTWANVPDANITQGSVAQHESALTILESQITDGTILARLGSAETITGAWTFDANVVIDNGNTFTIWDSTTTDKVVMDHDGTDFNFAFTNTTDWNITGIAGFNVANYKFDVDQTVGSGQDNFVLTYDDATGLISLESSGGGTVNMMLNLSTPAGNTILTNAPNTLRHLQNIDRYIAPIDLSDFTQVRMTCRVTTASASANTPIIILKYHTSFNTNIGSASDMVIGGLSISLSTLGYQDTGFVTLVSGAQASIWVMPGDQGGDGGADPRFSNLKVQFK